MATPDQYIELSSLPEEVRKKVMAFAIELMDQWRDKNTEHNPGSPKKNDRWVGRRQARCSG